MNAVAAVRSPVQWYAIYALLFCGFNRPRPKGADLSPTLKNPPKLQTPRRANIVPAPPIDPIESTPPMLPMLRMLPTEPAGVKPMGTLGLEVFLKSKCLSTRQIILMIGD